MYRKEAFVADTVPRRICAVTKDVPTSLLMEEFALGTEPNERLVIMRDVRAMQRKDGVCLRHGAERKTCSQEGCNNHIVKDFVLGMVHQRKRIRLAVEKDAPIRYGVEGFV